VAYVLRKRKGYWFGQGDRTYALSSDLSAWWEYPQQRRLPPLSADEKAAIDKATEERRRTGRVLDRAAALEKWGRLPETKKAKATKKHRAVGRPADYPVEIIRQVARDYITVYGLPKTQAMLREKVRDEAERNGFNVPGETRLKQLVGPIYKARSRKKSQSH
jgi:hypothetical protein